MSKRTDSPPVTSAGQRDVADWRPGRGGAVLMIALAVALLPPALAVYLRLATLLAPAAGDVATGGLLLFFAVTLALTGLLLAAHEGLHAVVARAFGAHPRFGALLVGGLVPALYTTAPGHLFSRGAYLAMAALPAVVISMLGGLACLTPAGLLLVAPFALHLSGCAGDFMAILQLLREPRGTRCEDLKDGIRFYHPSQAA